MINIYDKGGIPYRSPLIDLILSICASKGIINMSRNKKILSISTARILDKCLSSHESNLDLRKEEIMIDIKDVDKIKVDIFLKVLSDNGRSARKIIELHKEVADEMGYTWWGNNQPFTKEKLYEFYKAGQSPQALMVIPTNHGGNGNIRYIADILDAERNYKGMRTPDSKYMPQYYQDKINKVWLKLSNIKKVINEENYDVKNYFILSNEEPLSTKINTQYSCGYVYRYNDSNLDYTIQNDIEIESDNSYTVVEVDSGGKEGRKKQYYVTKYERNPINREKCIELQGTICKACSFDFSKTYGQRGKNYIEIHHVKPLHSLDEEVEINPATDLVPICSNCHRMIHRKKNDILTVEQLNKILDIQKKGS